MPVDSPKSERAEARLPVELRPIYCAMVDDYESLTQLYWFRGGYPAYEIFAEMILAGWRPSADPHPKSLLTRRDTKNAH
jgi:hypothetical protein